MTLLSTLLAAGPIAAGAPARDATAGDWVMLGVYLTLAIGVSFLCSMLEAGLLSVPASHVEVMARENRRGGARLRAMKRQIDRPLAAILTLNTVAHTVGAAGTGAQILVIFGNRWVALGSAVVTLLILVFSEIIPKSFGAAHAKRLAGFTAYAVQGLIWITLPLLIPLQWVSRWFGGGHGATLTRDEIAVTAELGHSAGILKPQESRVIRNLLRLGSITVEDVMTPRPVVLMLQRDRTVAEVFDEHGRLRFSRIPVYGKDRDDVTGHVTRFALHQARHEGHGDAPLLDLAQPLGDALEADTVADTLDRLIRDQQHLLRVRDEFGGTAGLVTLEDCVETLLGVEIVDETDTAEDMREAARRLLERRRAQRG
ncbi:MAG: hemolysin family protein [Planctomycetota bacterium]